MYINSQLLFAILSLLARHSTFVTDRLYDTDGGVRTNLFWTHINVKINMYTFDCLRMYNLVQWLEN